MKNTLLVPIDFSNNAITACHYACDLAQVKGYHIHLFHCYTSSSTSYGDERDLTLENETGHILKADLMMQEIKSTLQSKYAALEITSECTRGLIEDSLIKKTREEQYVMVVMGAKGSSPKKSYYWGSTTVAVTSRSEIPVLAIPEVSYHYPPCCVSLLTKFKPEELETLKTYVHLVSDIEKLTLVHVYREEDDKDDIDIQLKSWLFSVNEMSITNDVKAVSDHILSSDIDLDTVPEVVNKLINDNETDMVLVTKNRKSFFRRLFQSSVSKQLTLDLQKPTFFDRHLNDED